MIAFTLSTPKKDIRKSKLKSFLVICTCLVVIGLSVLPSYALGGVNRNPTNFITRRQYYGTNNSNELISYNLTTPGIAYMSFVRPSGSSTTPPPNTVWSFVDWTTNTNTFTFTNNYYPYNRYTNLVFNSYQREASTFYRSNFFVDNSLIPYGDVEFSTAFTINTNVSPLSQNIYVYFGLYVANSSLLSNYNFDNLYGNKARARYNIAPSQPIPLGLDNYRSSFVYLDTKILSPQLNYTKGDTIYYTTFRVTDFQNIIDEFETKKRILSFEDNASASLYHLYPIIIYDFGPSNDFSVIREIKNPSFTINQYYSINDYNMYRNAKLLNIGTIDPSAGDGFLLPDGETIYNPYNHLPFSFFSNYWASMTACSCIGLLLMLLPIVLILKGGLR